MPSYAPESARDSGLSTPGEGHTKLVVLYPAARPKAPVVSPNRRRQELYEVLRGCTRTHTCQPLRLYDVVRGCTREERAHDARLYAVVRGCTRTDARCCTPQFVFKLRDPRNQILLEDCEGCTTVRRNPSHGGNDVCFFCVR